MVPLVTIQFARISDDHQRTALYQTKVQFWACFVGAWVMFGVGLVPIAFLLIMPPQPWMSKITGLCLSASFEMFSLCFARSLKQARKWLDEHYDRARRDERMIQARQTVESIQSRGLRDKMRAEIASKLIQEDPISKDRTPRARTAILQRLISQE